MVDAASVEAKTAVTPTFSHRSANGTNWYVRKRATPRGDNAFVTWDDLTPEERAAIVADRLLGPTLRSTTFDDVANVATNLYKGLIVKQLQMSDVLFEKMATAKQQLRATPLDQFASIPVRISNNVPPDQVWLMDPNGQAIKVDIIAGK